MLPEQLADETSDRLARVSGLVEGHGSAGRWLVLTHDNPDPDSITAAALLAKLLRDRFHRRVTIAYGGLIGRAENREMVHALHLPMSHRRHITWRNYRHFALVDTQPRTGNNQLPGDILPDLVFDHHPLRRLTREVPIFDVRPEYGATATILAEYMLAAGVALNERLATALVYAIRTETQDFRREFAPADRALYHAFLPQADNRILGRIERPRLPLGYFRTLHRAMDNMEGVGKLIISHMGKVDQPDIVPELADLLLRMEGKTWSLATGRHDERLYLSLRTTNPQADAGRLMRRLIGSRGKGGGHGMTAGGWVALDAADGDDQALEKSFGLRLVRALKQNPEKLAPLAMRQEAASAEPSPPAA